MKNLVFAALMLGGLTQATGCIIESGDDDIAFFHAEWNLVERLATSPPADNPISCADAGVVTIRHTSRPAAGGADFIDLFDCVDQNHETADLPAGTYEVWVDALDGGNNLIAQSFAADATAIAGQDVHIEYTFPTDVGNFELTWTLVDDATNAPLTCTEAGSGGVSVLATPVLNQDTFTDNIFACEDGGGLAIDNLLGEHTVVVTVLGPNDENLGQSQPRNETLAIGNEVVDLGNFEFAFQ